MIDDKDKIYEMLLEIKGDIGAIDKKVDVNHVQNQAEQQATRKEVSDLKEEFVDFKKEQAIMKQDIKSIKDSDSFKAGAIIAGLAKGVKKYWIIPTVVGLVLALWISPIGTILQKKIWGDTLSKLEPQKTTQVQTANK